jgi:hypothetical protein
MAHRTPAQLEDIKTKLARWDELETRNYDHYCIEMRALQHTDSELHNIACFPSEREKFFQRHAPPAPAPEPPHPAAPPQRTVKKDSEIPYATFRQIIELQLKHMRENPRLRKFSEAEFKTFTAGQNPSQQERLDLLESVRFYVAEMALEKENKYLRLGVPIWELLAFECYVRMVYGPLPERTTELEQRAASAASSERVVELQSKIGRLEQQLSAERKERISLQRRLDQLFATVGSKT